MRKNLLCSLSVGLITVLCAVSIFAQEQRDTRTISAASSIYVVSAKAGGVNFIEGKVAVERKQGRSGILLKGDELEVGDRVSTDAGGRAEILLNPGSFVRLAGDSKFEFLTTSLDDLQLKLNGGSAMFEIITDSEFTVAINTPKAKFYIVKSGVYRIDVLADGSGKIEVWKGEAQVSDANATKIKAGKQATVTDRQATIAKFDRDEKDEFEIWSRARAKELSKINAQFQRTRTDRLNLRNSLLSSYNDNIWNINDSYGVWIRLPYYGGGYCFLPFGYGWSSPYGYYYRRDIWQYYLPSVVNNPPRNVASTVDGGNTAPSRKRESVTEIAPPYKRVQRDIGQAPQQMPQPIPMDIAPMPSTIPIAPMPASVPAPSKRGGN